MSALPERILSAHAMPVVTLFEIIVPKKRNSFTSIAADFIKDRPTQISRERWILLFFQVQVIDPNVNTYCFRQDHAYLDNLGRAECKH